MITHSGKVPILVLEKQAWNYIASEVVVGFSPWSPDVLSDVKSI